MEYEIKIDGKKVTADIRSVRVTDRQGAQADDIRLVVNNNSDLNISEGQSIECSFGGFKSGKMNMDGLSSGTVNTVITSVSAPTFSKAKKTRHWLKVRLFDIVNDVAKNCGASVFYQGVENLYYENVTQFKETDLAFLNRLCKREGYALKVDDNRLVIYSNAVIEASRAVLTVGQDDILDNKIVFSENPNRVRSVTVKHFSDRLISYTATNGSIGEDITIIEYCDTEAEAERYAKSYLSAMQQNEITVDALIRLDDGVAAGNCVEFKGFARFDGKYVVSECSHDPENDQTRLCGRRVK